MFDPFEDRACRDVRNRLGHAFAAALASGENTEFQQVVEGELSQNPPEYITVYIQQRVRCFDQATEQVRVLTGGDDSFFATFRILWNLGLFFECHEWLEKEWLKANGDEKKALQALILSAVVFELLEYNRTVPAKKLGLKAAERLQRYGQSVPSGIHIRELILVMETIGDFHKKAKKCFLS